MVLYSWEYIGHVLLDLDGDLCLKNTHVFPIITDIATKTWGLTRGWRRPLLGVNRPRSVNLGRSWQRVLFFSNTHAYHKTHSSKKHNNNDNK